MCPRQKELHFSWRGRCGRIGYIVWDNKTPVITVVWNSKCRKRRVAPGVVAGVLPVCCSWETNGRQRKFNCRQHLIKANLFGLLHRTKQARLQSP